ncbi:MAG TPA: hypothetical protein VKG65_09295 [Terriglobales bacterium]|nr:hypothetical protein [Terriglobales bacterium]
MTDTPETSDDESERYRPACKPVGEDVLFGIILDLLEQACGTADPEILDSWAISAHERAIEAIVEAGFAEMQGSGRITARLSQGAAVPGLAGISRAEGAAQTGAAGDAR